MHYDVGKFINAENELKNISKTKNYEVIKDYPEDYKYKDYSESYYASVNNLYLTVEKIYEMVDAARTRIMLISSEFAESYMSHMFSFGFDNATGDLFEDMQDNSFLLNFFKNFFGLENYILGEENVSSLYNSFFEEYAENGTYGMDQGALHNLMRTYPNGEYYLQDEDSNKLRDYLMNKYMSEYNMSYYDAWYFLSSIDNIAGVCTYASFCNNIYTSYNGKEKQFEDDFGFSMYRTKSDGSEVLNSEELLADVYLYMNLESNGGKLFYEDNGSVKAGYTVDRYGQQYIDTKKQVYMESGKFISSDREKEKRNYLKSHNANLEYESSSIFSHNSDKLKTTINEGISNNKHYILDYYDNTNKKNDIVMYDVNNMATSIDYFDGGGHSVYITGANDRGVEIASWGEKYTIEWEDLENNKTNFRIIETEIGRG